MAVALKNLTKSYWSSLKSDAGIAKAPWYKKADAAVGPAIVKLEKARAGWKREKGYDTFVQYVEALEKLDKAFDKFVIKKDVESSAEKKNVAKEILDWKTEIATKTNSLKTKYPLAKLEKLNAKAMADRRDAIYAQINVD